MDARGVFITFEGIDGAGKTTQLRQLAEDLRAAGRKVRLTREPGGSAGAEDIRSLLVQGDAGRWSGETECLLFTAARRDHMEKTVLPALAAGEIVLCDRFADSTRVYQGLARGNLRAMVDRLHDEFIAREPDLTFILDMPPEAALSRGLARRSGEDRFEDMGLDFQQRLRAGFLAIAREYADRCRVIDAARRPEVIAGDIAAQTGAFLDAQALA